jgi:hypothetical protein
MRRVLGLLTITLACACGSSELPPAFTQPEVALAADLANADRASLLVWKETLGPSYPLTIRGRDTVTALVRLVAPTSAEWAANKAEGTPIIAAIYSGNEVAAELGFIETSHGQGGFFVRRQGNALIARPATADELGRFMAFFGIGVVLIQ